MKKHLINSLAGGGGVTHMSSKKPLLSLACILALSTTINAQRPSDNLIRFGTTHPNNFFPTYRNNSHMQNFWIYEAYNDTGGAGGKGLHVTSGARTNNGHNLNFASVGINSNSSSYVRLITKGTLNVNEDLSNKTIQVHYSFREGNSGWTNHTLNNTTIKYAKIDNQAQSEYKATGGTSTIEELHNEATRVVLKKGNGGTINVTILNQNSNGSTEIYDGVNVTNANVNNGKFYQQGGTIATLTIKNGEFKQGYQANNNAISNDGDGGTITNLTIDNGTFTKAKGSVTGTITNTNGNINNMANSSINTITSTNGNITNAGTITSLTYKATPTTKAIQTKANTDSITNTGTITTLTNDGGHITNSGNGNITNLTNSNGNVNNSANIQTYTQESGNTMQSGGTIQTLTQKGGNFTYQGGTIGSLNQEGGSFNNLQQNISLFTTQGGSLNNYQGTIDTLKINSGDFELNNMQQGRIANIEIGGNGKININDNMNIGYHNGISTFRIASGATPTLNFGEVRTATTAQETYATVKLVDNTNNANTTQARVAIDKLTIALVGEDTQIGKSVSLANSVSGAANSGVGNVYVKSADFSQDLKQSGFYGTFNAQTQTIDTRFNA
ncbi:hypothetical protein, partial [Campylobacter upsaliensis]|uniref:hypothetical protein n=2 Tax=Campylobacter upsaliensis TaxID=28080 RepID=UPI0022EAEF54